MKSNPDRWNQVLGAVKAARRASASLEEIPLPPNGFATRVAARGAELRREQAIALWRRWSMRGAIGSTCLFLVAAVYAAATQDPGQILPLPAFEFPPPSP